MGQRSLRAALQSRNPGRVRTQESGARPRESGSSGRGSPLALNRRRVVHAFAKINLCLKVIGRRPDGLHEIETAVQTVSLHDVLTLEARDQGITLEADAPWIPGGPENLAARAAAALPVPGGERRGVHIRIHKTIPAGAGLGGGSSDAAAVLLGLRRLWGLDLSDEELQEIAAPLGADVPFFVRGGTALLTGTGTRVEPLDDLLGYEIVVVFPGTSLATREVYSGASESLTSAFKISSMPSFKTTLTGNLREEVEAWVRAGNDLEPYARTLCPAIGEIRERLQKAGATSSSMTGSGSAVFGIFRDGAAVERGLSSARAGGFTAMRCVPLGREDYRRGVDFE